ncbi:MAG: hypothetical protein ACREJ3_10195 [Polyangiaceae bacterium]
MIGKKQPKALRDEEAARRRAVLTKLSKMSREELFALGQRAGIYTMKGKLTKEYREGAGPSVSRPMD